MRRSALAATVVGSLVVATGAGWFAGSRVKSPAQLAAETSEPVPSLITFPVEKRVLSSDLILRGTVRYSDPISVVLAPSLLKPNAVLVSVPPVRGQALNEGDVALVVSGRPVFVLQGVTPGYRDLGLGMVGEDIRQLEAALARKGFDPGTVDGIFDASTAAAASTFYARSGYAPFGPNDAQLVALQSAQSNVSLATDRLLQVRQALVIARQGPRPADIVDAMASIKAGEAGVAAARSAAERDAAKGAADIGSRENAVLAANVALEDAHRRAGLAASGANTSTGLKATSEQIAQLQLTVDDANVSVVSAEADLAASTAIAETVRKNGEASVADAKAKLASVMVAVGLLDQQQQLDLANATRTAQSASLVAEATAARDNTVAAADVTAKANAVKSAKVKVVQAERSLATGRTGIDPVTGLPAVTPGDQATVATALRQAELASAGAAADLDAMRRSVNLGATANDSAVLDAQSRLAAARARLAAIRSPVTGTKTLAEAIRVAEAELARQNRELSKITKSLGVQVPANEILFFAALPLRIDDTKIKRGDSASAEVMTVSGTRLAIDSSLLTTEASLTKLDASATVDAPEFGFSTKGHVTFLADKPGLRGTDAQHIAIEVTPDDAPTQLVGASVRLTIPTETTGGEALVVPVAALFVRADGTTEVQIEERVGTTRTVIVSAGLSAQGFVEITPLRGEVAPGDHVVIGSKDGSVSALTSPRAPSSIPGTSKVQSNLTFTTTSMLPGETRAP